MALLIVGVLTEVFIIIATSAADAYTFAISMCTVTIATTWASSPSSSAHPNSCHLIEERGQLWKSRLSESRTG